MSRPRIDPYTFPHKALRRVLFDLVAGASVLDADAGAELRVLHVAAKRSFTALEEHAHNEETFLHPVIALKLPDVVDRLTAEHRESEARIAALRSATDAVVGGLAGAERSRAALELYRDLARFAADYLVHLDEEEALLPTYWERFDDDELGEVMARFRASRKPSDAMTDLERMLPALTPAERAQVFEGVRASAAPDGFRKACQTARRVLDDRAWEKLRACIEQAP
jgi:L-rhamnose mutarotase